MHIDPSAPERKITARTAEAAVARAGEQARDEGRVFEGGHDQAQEAQFGREEDCEGAVEQREGRYGIHSGRRCVNALEAY
jgi:hypothetical protein